MLQFTIDGLTCHVDGPLDERETLFRKLSVFDTGAKFKAEHKYGAWDGWVRLYNPEEQTFLSGMVELAVEKLAVHGVSVQVTGERLPPPVIEPGTEIPPDLIPGRVARPYQRRATYKSLFHRGGVIEIPTAGGKTFVAAYIIKILDRPTVFLLHQVNLLRQTARAFEQYGLRGVGIIGDSTWDPNFVTVATVQTLHRSLKRWDGQAHKFLQSREVMIFDETHHLSSPSWQHIVHSSPPRAFRYGLSGTPFKSRDLKRYEDYLLLGLCGPRCYSVSPRTLIEQGWIADPSIYMVYIGNPQVQGSGSKDYQGLYDRAIVEHETRNLRALHYITKFAQLGLKTLVIVRIIRHGLYLLNELARRGVPAVFLKGSDEVFRQTPGAEVEFDWRGDTYAAEVSPEEDHILDYQSRTLMEFREGSVPVLIGSPVLDEGVDVPEIEALLNLSGGRSSIKTRQRLGRGMRPKLEDNRVIVVDFYDRQHDLMRRHSLDRQKEYRLDGHTVLRDQELDNAIEAMERRRDDGLG